MEFKEFPKIPRLSRECFVTEKIDGTNASVMIEGSTILACSKNTVLTSEVPDNFGFRKWVESNAEELLKLGDGHHQGEWYGLGIQRGYALKEKRWALFNTSKWSDPEVRPQCCDVVPVLWSGIFSTPSIDTCLKVLQDEGSVIAPGFMKPEGVIIYHVAANFYFKKTIEKDGEYKSK